MESNNIYNFELFLIVMVSGNFFIREDMCLEDFSELVEPVLTLKGYRIVGKDVVNRNSERGLLVSIVGEGDLLATVNHIFRSVGKKGLSYSLIGSSLKDDFSLDAFCSLKELYEEQSSAD